MGKRIYDLEEIQQIDDNDYLLIDRKGTEESQKIKASNFKSFIVNITISMNEKNNFEIVSDKTYDEIYNAYNLNQQIVAYVVDTHEGWTYCVSDYVYVNNNFNFHFCENLRTIRMSVDTANHWYLYWYEAVDKEELKLHSECLKYYGDPDIVPSDESLFDFTIINSGASIKLKDENKSISGEIVIPYKCTIDGEEYFVTFTGTSGFKDCSNITKIIVPNTVESMSLTCFSGCTSLKKINISNRMTRITNSMFKDCINLTEINIPYGVTVISNNAFDGCTNLTSINIPSTVTVIYTNTFKNCPNLTITCAEGSAADKLAQENGIKVEYTNEVTKEYVDDLGAKLKTELQEWLDEQIGVVVNGEY